MKIVNYLDITLNLNDGSYRPYKNANEETNYIHVNSDHHPSILKQLPKSIEKRLSSLSSSKEIFEDYANIFMGKFEKTYIYPYINLFSNFYCRLIDDIFFLWNGTVVQLQEFIKKLNNCHPTIKFDLKFSKTSIEFLDTTVYKNKEQNKLLTTVYCKPTDRRNFTTLYLCSS